jgi:hypothetical protein
MKIVLFGIQLILLVLWYTVATTMPAWLVFMPMIIIGAVLGVMLVSGIIGLITFAITKR